MSNYPSVIASLTNPQATDKLNSPSHSTIETAQNDEIIQIETVLGTASSILGTVIGDLRNSSSGGGGHIQTVSLGGTGQTGYNKGDLLVASSSSVLSKFNVGSDNSVLFSDSSSSTGVSWKPPVRLVQNTSIVTVIGNNSERSILSATLPSSILSSINVIRAQVYISNYTIGTSPETLLIKANYGNNTIASVLFSSSGISTASIAGKIEFTLLAAGSTSLQRGELLINLEADRLNLLQTSVIGLNAYRTGTSSINSTANQILGLTAQLGTGNPGTRLDVDSYFIEKIL